MRSLRREWKYKFRILCEELIKGDESFIRIKNSCSDTTNFVTDKPKKGIGDCQIERK